MAETVSYGSGCKLCQLAVDIVCGIVDDPSNERGLVLIATATVPAGLCQDADAGVRLTTSLTQCYSGGLPR